MRVGFCREGIFFNKKPNLTTLRGNKYIQQVFSNVYFETKLPNSSPVRCDLLNYVCVCGVKQQLWNTKQLVFVIREDQLVTKPRYFEQEANFEFP